MALFKRHLSEPAFALLQQAAVPPQEVHDALQQLVWAKASAILRRQHPIVKRIREATDINVVQIRRQSGYLLIEIEQSAAGSPLWQYREHAPSRCTFVCRGQIPASIGIALDGELLEKLVVPAAAMASARIAAVKDTGDGWLEVDIAPGWRLF